MARRKAKTETTGRGAPQRPAPAPPERRKVVGGPDVVAEVEPVVSRGSTEEEPIITILRGVGRSGIEPLAVISARYDLKSGRWREEVTGQVYDNEPSFGCPAVEVTPYLTTDPSKELREYFDEAVAEKNLNLYKTLAEQTDYEFLDFHGFVVEREYQEDLKEEAKRQVEQLFLLRRGTSSTVNAASTALKVAARYGAESRPKIFLYTKLVPSRTGEKKPGHDDQEGMAPGAKGAREPEGEQERDQAKPVEVDEDVRLPKEDLDPSQKLARFKERFSEALDGLDGFEGREAQEILDTLRAANRAVREVFAERLEAPLNRRLQEMPSETYGEKQFNAKWTNAELGEYGLGIRCPKTGRASILVADPGDNPEVGRYQFQNTTPEERKVRPVSTPSLPHIKPIPAESVPVDVSEGREAKYLTVAQAAERLGRSERIIRKHCETGTLKGATRVGEHSWLIPLEAVEERERNPLRRGPKSKKTKG